MDCYPPESKLSDNLSVFRVKKHSKKNFTKDNLPQKPPQDLFNLTTWDKEEGEKRKKQPLLSVWESSIDKNHLFENTNITEEELSAVYKLSVGRIHGIQTNMIPIEVHWDPCEMKQSGHLHAGVQGLYRMRGMPKHIYKELKHELIQISELMH